MKIFIGAKTFSKFNIRNIYKGQETKLVCLFWAKGLDFVQAD